VPQYDAYLFAYNASAQAKTDVAAMVGDEVRVACPILGCQNLYVAVADDNYPDLLAKVAAVAAVDGIGTLQTFVPISDPGVFTFPTYALVDDFVGFSFVITSPGQGASVYSAVQSVTGVIGATRVVGVGANVLVEISGASQAAVGDAMDDVAALTNVVVATTAIGATSSGAGWPT
jgi:hypothetical protein